MHKCEEEMVDAFRQGDTDKARAYLKSGVSPSFLFRAVFERSYHLWENTEHNRQYKSQQEENALALFLELGGFTTEDDFYYGIKSSSLSVVKSFFLNENLRQNRKVGHDIISWHIVKGNVEIVEFLVKQNIELNPKNRMKTPPLTTLCDHPLTMRGFYLDNFDNQLKIAKLLIENGADVNYKEEMLVDSKGNLFGEAWTPLTKAIKSEQYYLVKFLIENGADVNLANGNGQTPLTTAVDGDIFSSDVFAKLLVENGADVNLANARGQTPLSIAHPKYGQRVFYYLKSQGAK